MSHDESSWRELAEKATTEHDSKELMAIGPTEGNPL